MRRWPSLLLASLLLLCSCNRKPPAPAPSAAPTSSLAVYCSVDQEYAEAILARFSLLHPEIAITPLFDTETTKTTGLVERLRAEKSRPQADFYWSSEVFLTIRLADEGLLAPLDLPELSAWPEAYRDPQRRWYAFAGRFRVIALLDDPALLRPASLLNLAEPAFKGLVIADPNFGTTRGHVASLFAALGSDNAARFLRDLKANDVRVVASNSQAVREVTDGRARYALTDSDDVWAAQRNGAAITCVPAALSPTSGPLVIPNTFARIAGRPDSPAALAFALFILSPETEKLLADSDSHNLPLIHTDIPLPAQFQLSLPASSLSYTDIAAHMDAAVRTANEILLK